MKKQSYNLRLFPDPVLNQVCNLVSDMTDDLVVLIHRMHMLMSQHEGIGLAAPQVGVLQRFFVMNIEGEALELINPEIIQTLGSILEMQEGCLSLPGMYVPVRRHETIDIAYTDLAGNRQIHRMTGLKARCAQHELDHLNGRLHIVYWPPQVRYAELRRYTKIAKRQSISSPQTSNYLE